MRRVVIPHVDSSVDSRPACSCTVPESTSARLDECVRWTPFSRVSPRDDLVQRRRPLTRTRGVAIGSSRGRDSAHRWAEPRTAGARRVSKSCASSAGRRETPHRCARTALRWDDAHIARAPRDRSAAVRRLRDGRLVRRQSSTRGQAGLHLDRARPRVRERAGDREPPLEDGCRARDPCAARAGRRHRHGPRARVLRLRVRVPGRLRVVASAGRRRRLGRTVACRLAVSREASSGRRRHDARPTADQPDQPLCGRKPDQRVCRRRELAGSVLVHVRRRQPRLHPPAAASTAVRPRGWDDRFAAYHGPAGEERHPLRLFGTGSVGSQILTGIPRLERLRFDPQLAKCSAVWPFETGWAPTDGAWLGRDVRIVHAEIYPSIRAPLPDRIKDRGQVRATWHWARDLDTQDLLVDEFAIPPGVTSGSSEDILIRSEEGWILGCPV